MTEERISAMQQPKRKRKEYQPYPGFCDLRLFELNSKQFRQPGAYRNIFIGPPNAGNIIDSLPLIAGQRFRIYQP